MDIFYRLNDNVDRCTEVLFPEPPIEEKCGWTETRNFGDRLVPLVNKLSVKKWSQGETKKLRRKKKAR